MRLAEHVTDEVDWVQGYKRYRSDPLNRRIVGAVYATAMGFLFGIPIRDIDCDFRLMRADHVRHLRLEKNSGAICVELVRGLGELDARCVEVEVDHFERPHGSSQFFRPRRIFLSGHVVRRPRDGRRRRPRGVERDDRPRRAVLPDRGAAAAARVRPRSGRPSGFGMNPPLR